MIAVVKGDIIASRKLVDQEKWLLPLKDLLSSWGESPKNWELVWGDFFQIEFERCSCFSQRGVRYYCREVGGV